MRYHTRYMFKLKGISSGRQDCPLSINAQNFRDVALKEDLQSDGQTFTKLSIVNNIKITIDIL